MAVKVRIDEGSQEQPILLWDSVWEPWRGQADWAIASSSETQNRGGLSAKAALHSSVIQALFTDKRISKDHTLFYLVEDGDQRGWFGDGVDVREDLHEEALGSLLWIFERAHLNEDIRMWVENIASEALMPFIRQEIAARIEVHAEMRSAESGGINLSVQMYARDGSMTYNYQFDDIWSQTKTSPKPPPFPDL